jgi:hypothetical protein
LDKHAAAKLLASSSILQPHAYSKLRIKISSSLFALLDLNVIRMPSRVVSNVIKLNNSKYNFGVRVACYRFLNRSKLMLLPHFFSKLECEFFTTEHTEKTGKRKEMHF